MSLSEEPFTRNELQSLDHFLRNQSSVKNGLNLTHAHGSLCAVLTAPTLSHTSYHSLFMDNTRSAANQSVHINNDCGLWLSKLTYQINRDLQEGTSSPLLFENNLITYEDASWNLINEWCRGYLRGAGLDPLWVKNDHALMMMMPMGILADEFNLVGLANAQNQPITDNMPHKILAREYLLTSIANLYDYWEEQRTSYKISNNCLH